MIKTRDIYFNEKFTWDNKSSIYASRKRKRERVCRRVGAQFIISCSNYEIMPDHPLSFFLSLSCLSRHFSPVPLLSRVFLIYQQLSFLPRPFSRRTLFRVRFMKWYFVQFHFSIRLDLLARGEAGLRRRHLISKVSRNSYIVPSLQSVSKVQHLDVKMLQFYTEFLIVFS